LQSITILLAENLYISKWFLVSGVKMRKIATMIAMCMIFSSSIGAIATNMSFHSDVSLKEIAQYITIPTPSIDQYDETYLDVKLADDTTYFMSMTQPVVPKIIRTFELPFGSTDISIDLQLGPTTSKVLQAQIRPAQIPRPLSSTIDVSQPLVKDPTVYRKDALFPNTWYSYHVGCGIDDQYQHVTFVTVDIYPIRYNPVESTITILQSASLNIQYKEPDTQPFPQTHENDMVIIAPAVFSDLLQPLIDHKNTMGVNTYLQTTENIYAGYNGVDKPEQIKYFIKDAIETQGINYVLLVGGLDSLIAGVSRDDKNQGSKDWHLPVRYSNLYAGEGDDPGYITDLYYADIYKEGGEFDNWDSDGNGVFAEWDGFRKDTLDLYPDVFVGRLACRNENEVIDMVNKIITYESIPSDDTWFKRIITVAGDAFQDQPDLNIIWDTTILPDGRYTINAQSSNPADILGPIDMVHVTIDHAADSVVTFVEDDHLKTDTYPFVPIAEITSPSEGDILGATDVSFVPPEAYDGYYWAQVEYTDGIMHIRGKSYDPQPYGNVTDLHLWITDEDDQIIFEAWRNNIDVYYEDEWTTGDKLLDGRGGTAYYMPDDFEKVMLWTSNGNWASQADVIDALSQGSGFVHFFGHASPRTWGDQYPGIPGGRGEASVTGLITFDPFTGPPFLPMSKIKNTNKLPIVVAGGCHNGQFNVTLLSTLLQRPYMWTYGVPVPECWSWWLTRLPDTGSIATISNTAMGYGLPGKECISGGLNGWLDTEFFRLYAQGDKDTVGDVYANAIHNYIDTFDMEDPEDGVGHVKAIQEWTLLGDPSLMVGGYS
jgi:hypothetical protein